MKNNKRYVTVAYDIGLTNGVSATQFAPAASATREQAATMLVRIYEKYTAKTSWLHGFYAISSYSQIGLTQSMDAVSLGWSRMTYAADTGAVLNTTTSGGNVYAIPSGYADAVKQLQANGCQMNLCINYGGRDEILHAVRRYAEEYKAGTAPELTEELIGSYLYSGGIPDPDLIIRTSGEQRLSNFLPWQGAYSELYFTDVLWPDFTERDMDAALAEFQRRDRRFGGVK